MKYLLFDGIKIAFDEIESIVVTPRNKELFDHCITVYCTHHKFDKEKRFVAKETYSRESRLFERYDEIKQKLER